MKNYQKKSKCNDKANLIIIKEKEIGFSKKDFKKVLNSFIEKIKAGERISCF